MSVQDAIDVAARTLEELHGQSISYILGATTLTIPDAVLGSTSHEAESLNGEAKMRTRTTDWLIDPKYLVIDSNAFEPQPGHRIIADIGNGNETYEVQKLDQENCWRWSGPTRNRMRIHVRLIDG